MRVAILWQNMSGYMDSCIKQLEKNGCTVYVCHKKGSNDAPFDESLFSWTGESYVYGDRPDYASLNHKLKIFNPDIILISSWHIKTYKKISRDFVGEVPRVLCMDNLWLATIKQVCGVLARSFLIKRYFDFAFVPGEGAAKFARLLGFKQNQIFYGLYTADSNTFASSTEYSTEGRRKAFLQVSRAHKQKGIKGLVDAYARYRTLCANPWDLIFCGVGNEAHLLDAKTGVINMGFLSPKQISEVMRNSDCLVLNSRHEPWGVVIHEATSSMLPVISTVVCGASLHLVQDGHNGCLIEPESARALADAMLKISSLSNDELSAYRSASFELSKQYSTQRWAKTVCSISYAFTKLRNKNA